MGRLQFSIRSILGLILVIAVILSIVRTIQNSYYWQLNDTYDVLLSHPEIQEVQISGNDDLFYEVELISFTTNSNPGVRIEVEIPHAAGKSKIRRIIENVLPKP